MTPEAALLTLIAELRQRIEALSVENAQLHEALDDAVAQTKGTEDGSMATD